MDLAKKEVYQACVQWVEEQVDAISDRLDQINESASNDTKSSAGDKYETGREMLQAERDKEQMQLSRMVEYRKTLSMLPTGEVNTVDLGAILNCSLGTFYISIPIGEIKIGDEKIFCTSPTAPLILALKGAQENDQINFNGQIITIDSIE